MDEKKFLEEQEIFNYNKEKRKKIKEMKRVSE